MSSTASHHGGHATGRTFTSLLKEDSPSASCGEMVIEAEGVVNRFALPAFMVRQSLDISKGELFSTGCNSYAS